METATEIIRDDFLEFNKYVLIKSRFKKSFIIATIFTFFWIIILNYNISFDIFKILKELLLFYGLWAIFIFLFYQIHFYRIKKMPDKDGSILGYKSYIIEAEGLKEITDTSETLTKWNGIKSIVENDKYIFVFVDKIAAYVIPKRSFENSVEQNKFIQKIKERIFDK